MNDHDTGVCLILCTAAPEESGNLVSHLIGGGLAACINVFPVKSSYVWEGEYCCDTEDLLIIKTSTAKAEMLKDEILKIHSYDLPEIIIIPVTGGSDAYLEWVKRRGE
ncbi:divalent-cation tolerance protein CutA [Methanolacinia paynteri]|uniref:divalent-cation tolerance protein CutA n=1 Tax=Methanolacinia paynteri TaxID=230356 RepID=UPI00064FABA3|nr:divalent-cation tolerance protein CutA [Methanolacinia paynteri]